MSGRSRGRARTSTVPQPASVSAPGGALHPQQPPGQKTSPAQTSTTQHRQESSSPPTPPSPNTPPSPQAPQPGRGRGFAGIDQRSSIAPSLAASSLTASASATTEQTSSGSGGKISPPSNGESPTGGSPTHAPPMGRASLRGGPHQLSSSIRNDAIGQIERMTLQDPGDLGGAAGEQRQRVYFEQVLHTKPATCTEKVGLAGNPVKIYCNYFKVLSKPDWVLFQYHVDFSPVIESRRMRIALLKNHDALFPRNRAFDGSSLYSLTKLDQEITEVASTRETDQQIITIKIKRVGEIVPQSPQFVQMFNIVFRRY
jgi:hypothetical protein